MQTARIPLAILIALGMASASACKVTAPPCLNAPPPEYYEEADNPPPPEYDEEADPQRLDVGTDPELGPCLSPLPTDDPSIGPCLDVALPDEPPMTPCLMVVAPPENEPEPHGDRRSEPLRTKPPKAGDVTSRAEVLEQLADSLPPDVLAKLRKRKE